MTSHYEAEVILSSAKDLKNVNWRNGSLKPYGVLWFDPKAKCSTRVDHEGDTCPVWDVTLVLPLTGPIQDSTLYIDIVHAGNEDDTKPLIGSAKLRLTDIVDDVGLGHRSTRTLKLKRPSGRPHGKLEVKICVREPPRYHAHDAYFYAQQPPRSRDYYSAPPPLQHGNPYGQPPQQHANQYYSAAPAPVGYTSYGGGGHGAPPQPAYGGLGQPSYDQQGYGGGGGGGGGGKPAEKEKKSKYGMGTGLAVGAAAGFLGRNILHTPLLDPICPPSYHLLTHGKLF